MKIKKKLVNKNIKRFQNEKKVLEANKEKKTRKNKKKQAKSKEADSLCEKNKLHLQTHRYTDTPSDTHGQTDKPHCIILYQLLLTPCTSPCPYVRPRRRP